MDAIYRPGSALGSRKAVAILARALIGAHFYVGAAVNGAHGSVIYNGNVFSLQAATVFLGWVQTPKMPKQDRQFKALVGSVMM